MLTLKDFEHLREVKEIAFKEETLPNGDQVTILSYMIGHPALWDIPLAKECRGITFDSHTGQLLSRPFPKFFNVGEREDTQPHVLMKRLGDEDLFEVVEKKDGSMITPVLSGGKLFLKTKKSFYSDVAKYATEALEAEENAELKERMVSYLEWGLTPIYEFTSPDNQVVIDYGSKPRFSLICTRDMKTGELDYCETDLEVYPYSLEETLELCQTTPLRDREGFVIHIGSDLYKIKGSWYLENHRLRTCLRERDIFDMMMAETLDDIKSSISAEGLPLERVEELEEEIASLWLDHEGEVAAGLKRVEGLPLKDVRAKLGEHQLLEVAPLVFAKLRGTTGYEDLSKKLFINKYRQSFSLKTVLSNFGREG